MNTVDQAGALDGLRYRRRRPGLLEWAITIVVWVALITVTVIGFGQAEGIGGHLGVAAATLGLSMLVAGMTWLAVGGVDYVHEDDPAT